MPSYTIEELESKVGDTAIVAEDLTVEAGKVEEFARAINDDNPVFRNEQAAREEGFDVIPAPLTFTRVQFFPRYRPADFEGRAFDLGFDDDYVIHGEQEYEFERAVQVGDTLTGIATLEGIYQREGAQGGLMTFADIEIVFQDDDGEHVLTERKTLIETAGAVDDSAETAEKA